MAKTATAPGGRASGGSEDARAPLSGTLGRYKLEALLGAGGMGVVHAAFDPDLERRVALKVLRDDDIPEARQRLLREARAMARLTHPNVITVHEVGTADGRDYVAMELVNGTSLAEWLASGSRTTQEIIAAFVAAGRGLVAAHAAEIVHRDFKPHNVLRNKDGRICVMDFGLARGVDPSGMESTVRLRGVNAESKTTPSSLSGLTVTGSVLGTPAYMAPEQWSGGKVGPAADQFAFCVALWEALAGKRPFPGPTYEALQAAIEKGTDELDDAKIPRRLRPVLKRGLQADPDARWPSMNALLAAIARAERRPTLALAAAGGAIVVGVATFLAVRPAAAPSCDAPAIDPAAVEKLIAPLATKWRNSHAEIRADLVTWRRVRNAACKAPKPIREPRLACLDAVIARVDHVGRSLLQVKGTKRPDAAELLVDPVACENARPPRLIRTFSPQLLELTANVYEHEASSKPITSDAAAQMIKTAGTDPCALVVAHTIAADTKAAGAEMLGALDEAARAADRCGDDRVSFDVAALTAARTMTGVRPETEIVAVLDRAESLKAAVGTRDATAKLELLRAQFARRADKLDETIQRMEAARDLYTERGRVPASITAGLRALAVRSIRATPEDIALIPKVQSELRELAVRELGAADPLVRAADQARAIWLFAQGDVEESAKLFEALFEPEPIRDAIRMTGRVVDANGKPVAGATVITAARIQSSTATPAIAEDGTRRITTTRSDGTFEVAEAHPQGAVLAHADNLRSVAVDVAADVRLVLLPTSRIEGVVELRDDAPQAIVVVVSSPQTNQVFVSPVRADGSFALGGMPHGKVIVQATRKGSFGGTIAGTEVDAKQALITGLRLDLKGTDRAHHVLVRSTVGAPVGNAQVLIVPGRVATTNAHAIDALAASASAAFARPITAKDVPPIVKARAKAGDLFAVLTKVPVSEASACAISLPSNLQDPDLQKALADPKNLQRIVVPCVPVMPTDELTTVEVPPWPRFD